MTRRFQRSNMGSSKEGPRPMRPPGGAAGIERSHAPSQQSVTDMAAPDTKVTPMRIVNRRSESRRRTSNDRLCFKANSRFALEQADYTESASLYLKGAEVSEWTCTPIMDTHDDPIRPSRSPRTLRGRRRDRPMRAPRSTVVDPPPLEEGSSKRGPSLTNGRLRDSKPMSRRRPCVTTQLRLNKQPIFFRESSYQLSNPLASSAIRRTTWLLRKQLPCTRLATSPPDTINNRVPNN